MCEKKENILIEKAITIKFANFVAILVMLITGIITVDIIIKWNIHWTKEYFIIKILNLKTIIVYILLFVSIFLHEYIHAIFFKIFSQGKITFKKGESIKIGFNKQTLTPYCHCKEKLRLWQYIIAITAPGLFLGIIPYILSVYYREVVWLIFSWICVSSASADFYVVFMAISFGKFNKWVIDHPEKVGFYILKK